MPLQNRVTPEGVIIVASARGTMMGNRGGALHTPDRRLAARRWKTKAWICCVLDFKGRHRVVMSPNRYTELFFLDEATALAAGHRPCFECRRRDAKGFAEAWRRARGLDRPPRAPEMDDVLHPQRVGRAGAKITWAARLAELPDGTFVRWHGTPHLLWRGALRAWRAGGYGPAERVSMRIEVDVLTPRAIVGVLAAGYRPMLHASSGVSRGLNG